MTGARQGPRSATGLRPGMSPAEYQAHVDREISEAAFQRQVLELAVLLGWRWYHPPDNKPDARGRRQRVQAGFLDLVLVHPVHGVLFRELKTERGRVSEEQREWIAALGAAGANAAVWRPRDRTSGLIERELRGAA